MLGLDCGGFSGGSFDFVVFLVEGLVLSAVVHCMWWSCSGFVLPA
jgi:hypothetical protein